MRLASKVCSCDNNLTYFPDLDEDCWYARTKIDICGGSFPVSHGWNVWCGYPTLNASYYDLSFHPVSPTNDCKLYGTSKAIKCYDCDSCKIMLWDEIFESTVAYICHIAMRNTQ